MQKWEYKYVTRSREMPGDYPGWMREWDKRIESFLPELGNSGWELVTVVPNSSAVGIPSAGITTSERWIFKRPIPG